MTKSEAQTRSELIDRQLAQASWNVKDPTQVVEEFDILTALPEGVAEARTPYEGHQFSDYVLLGKDRKPMAVIEAKKTSRDAAEEAVNNVPPYLCNFQVMKIQTKFQMEGISKRTISLEDQKMLILQDKEVEEINFEGTQLEKQAINKGTNTLIVREYMGAWRKICS
ncbi:hypothetical protein [Acidithiobacillus concretivorus]|uniref:hypothetical protein n=1 Tax=Acidithiobacillus concretivorus TaxID=3063952 RepID=UPI001C0670C2|nr:hypothetical protein [Acidithiobacillus concretivorus]